MEWEEVKSRKRKRLEAKGTWRSRRIDIAGTEGRRRSPNDLTSYFFTEFPDNHDVKEMLNVFKKYGPAVEVVIPPKRDKNGHRFGFARFSNVRTRSESGVGENPLEMEVENVNNKHFVLFVKVKSVFDSL